MPPFKNRYMVVEVFLDPNRDIAGDETIILTQFNVSKAIKDSVQLNFGECGLASSVGSFQGVRRLLAKYTGLLNLHVTILSPLVRNGCFSGDNVLRAKIAFMFQQHMLKYVNPTTKLCIIRVAHKEYQMIWCAMTMVRSIGHCPVIFNSLSLSGSLRACKDAALKYDEEKFEHYKLTAKDGNSPQILEQVHNCFEKIKVLEM